MGSASQRPAVRSPTRAPPRRYGPTGRAAPLALNPTSRGVYTRAGQAHNWFGFDASVTPLEARDDSSPERFSASDAVWAWPRWEDDLLEEQAN